MDIPLSGRSLLRRQGLNINILQFGSAQMKTHPEREREFMRRK